MSKLELSAHSTSRISFQNYFSSPQQVPLEPLQNLDTILEQMEKLKTELFSSAPPTTDDDIVRQKIS